MRFYAFASFFLIALLSGCNVATPMATPTATRTPLPLGTETPLPPSATPTPRPTITPLASPTPVALAVTPFPPDVNPLTGLTVEDEAVLDRIPIAIKVSNSPQARPQSGLAAADLVFEHLSEGGVTRYTAIFYANEPAQVGSVRSGRLIDVEIPAMYHALFGYSGSSGGVKEHLRNSDLFPAQIAAPDFGVGQPYFYRVPQAGKAFEHTLFTNPAVLRELAEDRGINVRPEFSTYMAFSESIPLIADSYDATQLTIDYRARVRWDYDPEVGDWLRSLTGAPHVDAPTGEQLRFDNVVVIFAHHIEADFWEEMIGDRRNWKLSIQIQVWGQGPMLLFRNGTLLQGYWRREARDEMLTFFDGEGQPLPLKPGNTWFQVVPLGTASAEPEPGVFRLSP